jgi:ParB-like chromosome segregation protein Spo0J
MYGGYIMKKPILEEMTLREKIGQTAVSYCDNDMKHPEHTQWGSVYVTGGMRFKEENIIINDHTTTEDINDIELVKGIYDKMDTEIGKRDEEIRRLREELRVARGNDIPYIQVTREIANSYPAVKQVHIAQGASVTCDSLAMNPCMTVVVRCDSLMEASEIEKLSEWLKIRLNTEDINLIQQ